jgi:hypothetical protein
VLTSPRLSILNAELSPNDGESGAGNDGDGEDDGRERAYTNGLGAGNKKAKGDGGFLQETDPQSVLRLPAVHNGTIDVWRRPGPKHRLVCCLETEFSFKTEKRHRRIGCTDTTGRLPDYLGWPHAEARSIWLAQDL